MAVKDVGLHITHTQVLNSSTTEETKPETQHSSSNSQVSLVEAAAVAAAALAVAGCG
jgi:hypothetical protein